MPSKYISVIILVLLAACQTSEPEALYKISRDEIINLVKQNKLNYVYAKFVNQDRSELSKAMRKRLNRGELGMDYYVDKQGIIKEVRVRRIELADKIIEIQKRELSYKPLSKIKRIPIDCEKIDSIYKKVEQADQEARKEIQGRDFFTHKYEQILEVDSINQQIVVSAISECGYTEKHLSTILLIIEQASSPLIAYYYSDLKAFSNEGKVSRAKIAGIEDRLLLRHGYSQIYGTQIRNGQPYKLEEPEYVNERRERMDLEPIEEFLSTWGKIREEDLENVKNALLK